MNVPVVVGVPEMVRVPPETAEFVPPGNPVTVAPVAPPVSE